LSNPIFPKKANLDKETVNFIGTDNQRLIGIALAQYEAKVYPLDLMQDVIINWLKIQHIKFYFWRRKERNRNFRCSVKLKRQCYNTGKMKLQQELRSLAIWMSWFPWILGMLILQLCLSKSHHTLGCYASHAWFSPFHQPLENTLVSDRKISHATHPVYGNKIVVGYEDAMRTITPEMVVMSVQNS
jgi:hypothetical protein